MERSYKPVEVSKELLERYKKVPVATIWSCLHNYLGYFTIYGECKNHDSK